MAKVISTTTRLYSIKGSGDVRMAYDQYDDGGGVWYNPQNKNEWFAQVGSDNNYTFYATNLINHANGGGQFNLTTDVVNNFFYTQATTNSGAGGVFNQVRAQAIKEQTGSGLPFSKRQVGMIAYNGVPGLPGIGKFAGKISIVGGWRDDTNAQPTTQTAAQPAAPGGDPNNPTIQPVEFNPDLSKIVDQKPEFVRPSAKDNRNLRYPLNHAAAYDFIKIFPMEYKPAIGIGGIAGFQPGQADTPFSNVSSRYTKEKAGSMIFLPMIPAGETTSTGWGEDTMNALQKEFGKDAVGIIGGAFKAKDFQDWAGGALKSLKDSAVKIAQTPGLDQFIAAHFAGQAVNANILGRTGVAINPNLELLFSGPSLRSFSYNFKFTPREKDEAKEIRDIIKVFKKGMAPRRTQGNVFLNVPYVWQLEYIRGGSDATTARGGTQHPYLNKIKPCALKSFNVNYMPDGSYMTYAGSGVGGGSMTSYQVSMEFGELEPIYNQDIEMTGDNSNNMGY